MRIDWREKSAVKFTMIDYILEVIKQMPTEMKSKPLLQITFSMSTQNRKSWMTPIRSCSTASLHSCFISASEHVQICKLPCRSWWPESKIQMYTSTRNWAAVCATFGTPDITSSNFTPLICCWSAGGLMRCMRCTPTWTVVLVQRCPLGKEVYIWNQLSRKSTHKAPFCSRIMESGRAANGQDTWKFNITLWRTTSNVTRCLWSIAHGCRLLYKTIAGIVIWKHLKTVLGTEEKDLWTPSQECVRNSQHTDNGQTNGEGHPDREMTEPKRSYAHVVKIGKVSFGWTHFCLITS